MTMAVLIFRAGLAFLCAPAVSAQAGVPSVARRLWSVAFAVEASPPKVSSHLASELASELPSVSPDAAALTEESTEIVRGLVEGFLHRQQLEAGELECLSKGAGVLAGDLVQAAEQLMLMFEQTMTSRDRAAVEGKEAHVRDEAGSIEAKAAALSRRSPGSGSSEPQDRARTEASEQLDVFYSDNAGRRLDFAANSKLMAIAPSMLMQTGLTAKTVVTSARQTAKDCLHHDALAALDEAALHMESIEYISGHLVANGQDILKDLADAVEEFKLDNYRKFGWDFGRALRKVFLSHRGDSKLPEGLPSENVLANVTSGLIKGMFGIGAELDVKLVGDIDRVPQQLNIDLHKCISKNLAFFQSIWQEVMFIYAKRDAKASESDKVSWSTAVAFTMMNVPDAMDKCDLGPEKQEMLKDAVRGLVQGGEGLGYAYKAPESSKVSKDQIENHMAITAKDWASMKWSDFGEDMGHLLQEMAATAFSKKYSIDNGVLRKHVLELSAAPPVVGAQLLVARWASCTFGIGTLFAALFAIIVLRAARWNSKESCLPLDISRSKCPPLESELLHCGLE